MTSSEIRSSFLDFFAARGHTVVPSAPVVPHGDPTLYFTNAGMNQFKDVFLGTGTRDYSRAADTQKCIRVSGKHNDLEEVGHDTYHHTFFEMLGNWSFGDYYKPEAIAWAWELLTQVWKLDPARLHVTVYRADDGSTQDDEARDIWAAQPGMDPTHIHWFGAADNFWEMGETGPCGPCSEIHYDKTDDLSGGPLVNAGVPEVVEIWNLVFIQFNRNTDRSLTPLPQRHVDTGMGFERVCAVLQGVDSNYDTDVFRPLLEEIGRHSGHRYGATLDGTTDIAMRVIADHVRALSFAIADGASPGNAGRGYVLRRLLRRAVKYAYLDLDVKEPLLHKLVAILVEEVGATFPEIVRQRGYIEKIIRAEEESFLERLEQGAKIFQEDVLKIYRDQSTALITGETTRKIQELGDLNLPDGFVKAIEEFNDRINQVMQNVDLKAIAEQWKIVAKAAEDNPLLKENIAKAKKVVSGADAFQLYDTFGFPLDLTELLAREQEMEVDVEGFEKLMGEQRARARAARKSTSQQASDLQIESATEFIGYDREEGEAEVKEVVAGGVVLDRTPFYAEMGGQLADTGTIVVGGERYAVADVRKIGDAFLHIVEENVEEIIAGSAARAEIDHERRAAIERNHSATHLLHEALRRVLGDHVQQAGSLVAPEHLRFDFNHFSKLGAEELRDVEQMINDKVREGIVVETEEMAFDEARTIPNVKMFFGDKYGSHVRVVTIDPSFSREFCGGTHVLNSAEIGLIKLTAEESVQSGVRRLHAVSGRTADELLLGRYVEVDRLSRLLNVSDRDLYRRVEELVEEKKALEKELAALQRSNAAGGLDDIMASAALVDDIRLVTGRVDVADMDALKSVGDGLREKLAAAGGGIGLLGAAIDGKAMLVCVVTDDLTKRYPAGSIVGAAAKRLGGGGGGRPHLATAGGKDLEKLDEVLGEAGAIVGGIG